MIKLNNFKFILFFVLMFTLVVIPTVSLAQTPEEELMIDFIDPNNNAGLTNTQSSCNANIEKLGDVICKFAELLNLVIPVLISLGVVYLVYGVVQYFIGSDEEAKKKGRDRIIFGIIGLSVIVGLWGLVNIVVNTFDLDRSVTFVNPATVLNNSIAPGSCSLGGSPKFQDLLGYVSCIIGKFVIPLIFTLALASFAWGVVQFVIMGAGEEAKREEGRQFMIWGIIALSVMISVWGLVKIVGTTFNIDTTYIPQVKGK